MPTRIKLNKFKSAAALLLVSLALTACGGSFTPSTMEAAKCKKECNSAFNACKLPNCDAALTSCMDYCADVDRIKQKQQ